MNLLLFVVFGTLAAVDAVQALTAPAPWGVVWGMVTGVSTVIAVLNAIDWIGGD